MATSRIPDKPAAAAVASPLAIVLVWVASEVGLEVPPEVAAAFVALLIAAAYYIVPAKP
jgi:hypothetical protein